MIRKAILVIGAILGIFVYFSWDSVWYQSAMFPDEFWPKELDKIKYQIAYTSRLIYEGRDSRTNDQNLMEETYVECIDLLREKEKITTEQASNYLNSNNKPRDWERLNLEPKINEYVFDSTNKIKMQIIDHENWLVSVNKAWKKGGWTDVQYNKKKTQFCELVFEREEEIFRFSSATYYLAKQPR